MKKFFLSALIFLTLNVFAQIDKGNTLLGGNFGFGTQQFNPGQQSSTNSNLQPFIQFGYKANRTIGFGLDLSYHTNSGNDNQSKNRQFYFAPSVLFTQYHPLKGNFGWLLQENVGVGISSSRNENGNVVVKNNSTSVFGGMSPGVYYAAGEKKQWLLQATVGNVGLAYSKNSQDFENWSFNTSLFQYYRFGFAYVFRK